MRDQSSALSKMQTIFLIWESDQLGLALKNWLTNMDNEMRLSMSQEPLELLSPANDRVSVSVNASLTPLQIKIQKLQAELAQIDQRLSKVPMILDAVTV